MKMMDFGINKLKHSNYQKNSQRFWNLVGENIVNLVSIQAFGVKMIKNVFRSYPIVYLITKTFFVSTLTLEWNESFSSCTLVSFGTANISIGISFRTKKNDKQFRTTYTYQFLMYVHVSVCLYRICTYTKKKPNA